MKLLIVESPAKSKTIEKYLGHEFKVVATVGHIRDLKPKVDGIDLTDFSMKWTTQPAQRKTIDNLRKYINLADDIYLATDLDREGEAISWHVSQLFEKELKGKNVFRIVFSEITKQAISKAIKNPREINQGLVNAYLARRGIDFLMGFQISPELWRRLPGAKSAGRVQSVALDIISQRAQERRDFVPVEFWSVKAKISDKQNCVFANLISVDGKRISKLSIKDKQQVDDIVNKLSSPLTIEHINNKHFVRKPLPPLITASLQQSASVIYGIPPLKTMSIAQSLYEGVNIGGDTTGLITYMRTDSLFISNEFMPHIKKAIVDIFGTDFLPSTPNFYKSRSKNSQEAHEAIRPTDMKFTPDQIKSSLSIEQFKIYSLIYSRTLASQMSVAQYDGLEVLLNSNKDCVSTFRISGSSVTFDGYLASNKKFGRPSKKMTDEVYKLETPSNKGGDDEIDEKIEVEDLGLIIGKNPSVGDTFKVDEFLKTQNWTQPPKNYNEASLIKKMDELEIGRPSTYASIISTLKKREYVVLDAKKLLPTPIGEFLSYFLKLYFSKFVDVAFTASMEKQLDQIVDDNEQYKTVLELFLNTLKEHKSKLDAVRISVVIEELNKHFKSFVFPDGNKCPKCKDGTLSIKLSKFSPFVGCDKYPECDYSYRMTKGDDELIDATATADFPKTLLESETEKIVVNVGRFGPYVQLKSGDETVNASIPRGQEPLDITLESAKELIEIAKRKKYFEVLGKIDKDEVLFFPHGSFGPYIKVGKTNATFKGEGTPTIEEAIELIEKSKARPKRKFKKK
ncbi:MAG: type I DNA topoisomerase [Alphaproteobacteria bacterium]|nr:type I DNA topoisomerase [Alphaproteobacteria bacterium]MBL0718257.1 type I DNA topoisomerase [Alphaproteobacteria bacterium]